MAFLETVPDLYRLVELAFAERAGNRRSKQPRLFARRAVRHEPIDHDADGIRRHDEQKEHHALGQPTHLIPQGADIPTYGAALQQIKRPYLQLHFFSLSCELNSNSGRPGYPVGPGRFLLTQREVHVDLSYNLHRLSVEERRLVHPLFHRFQGGRDQQRVAADDLEMLNGAVLGDNRTQLHHALNARLLGQGRIDRMRLPDQLGLLHVAADPDALRSRFLLGRRRRRQNRRRDRTNDAAQNAASDAAGHAASNTTGHTTHARGRRRKLFFFDHRDVFRDALGRHQPASVELARDDPNLYHGSGRRGGRRRRRRRRRRHQETGQLSLGKHIEIDHREDHTDDQKDDLRDERHQDGPGLVRFSHAIYERLLKHTRFLSVVAAEARSPGSPGVRRDGAYFRAGMPGSYLTALAGLFRAVSGRGAVASGGPGLRWRRSV